MELPTWRLMNLLSDVLLFFRGSSRNGEGIEVISLKKESLLSFILDLVLHYLDHRPTTSRLSSAYAGKMGLF
jgi:hypothetical protein